MSKFKTILFRADSSSKIGTGHIMRDLVFAQKYAKKGAKIIFATLELEGNINHKIDEAGFELIFLKSNKKEELKKCLKNLSVDLLVIDHYGIDYKIEKYLKKKTGVKILSFDDTYEKHYCDIVLNHNISANKRRYKKLVPKYCKLCCGKKYTLIRDEFFQEKERKRKKKYDYFISIGGVDRQNLSTKIIQLLSKDKKICLVTTQSNKNLTTLKKIVKNSNNIKLYINTKKFAKFLHQSKFAIITPSVIVHEVLFMEMPFCAVKVVSNQMDIYKYLKKNGFTTFDYETEKKLFFNYLKKEL